MADPTQDNKQAGLSPGDLAAIVDAARRSADAAQMAAQAAADSARATQQIADDLRAVLKSLRAAPQGGSRAEVIDPDIQVVIAAAVATALRGRPFQVRRVRLAERPSLVWSQIGRSRIHASHAIEKRS